MTFDTGGRCRVLITPGINIYKVFHKLRSKLAQCIAAICLISVKYFIKNNVHTPFSPVTLLKKLNGRKVRRHWNSIFSSENGGTARGILFLQICHTGVNIFFLHSRGRSLNKRQLGETIAKIARKFTKKKKGNENAFSKLNEALMQNLCKHPVEERCARNSQRVGKARRREITSLNRLREDYKARLASFPRMRIMRRRVNRSHPCRW